LRSKFMGKKNAKSLKEEIKKDIKFEDLDYELED
jgi:hypothetical protein